MTTTKRPDIGSRVVAISHGDATNKIYYIFGYGVYEGYKIPEPGVKFMDIDLHEAGHENPAIKVDSGDYVYGCECWWTSENYLEQYVTEGWKIEVTDIKTARNKTTSN